MVSAWDLNLQLKKRSRTEEVYSHVSGEIIDDNGQRTTLVTKGRTDRTRGWDVEGGKAFPPGRKVINFRLHLRILEHRSRRTHTGLMIFFLLMNLRQVCFYE
jgi:hypothetical protein